MNGGVYWHRSRYSHLWKHTQQSVIHLYVESISWVYAISMVVSYFHKYKSIETLAKFYALHFRTVQYVVVCTRYTQLSVYVTLLHFAPIILISFFLQNECQLSRNKRDTNTQPRTFTDEIDCIYKHINKYIPPLHKYYILFEIQTNK